MYTLDTTITHWVNGLAGRSAAFDFLMISMSAVGVPVLVLAVIIQWWFPRPDPTTRHVALAAGFSFLLGLALNQIILLFVHRMRPYDGGITHLLIGPSSDYSFPSDHMTVTFAVAGAFLLYGKRGCGIAFLAAALLVAFSRVYVGTHYASDVFGGSVTGIIAAVLVRLFYRQGTRADRFLTNIL